VSVTVSDVKKTFNTVNFAITGPDGASTIVQTGSADFGPGGRTITIGSVPVGSNYEIAFTTASSDGTVTCSGSTAFSIESGMRTLVEDPLLCVSSTPRGGQSDSAAPYTCATSATAMANPVETTVGSSVILTATATGQDPNEIGYWWSAPSGTFSAPGA